MSLGDQIHDKTNPNKRMLAAFSVGSSKAKAFNTVSLRQVKKEKEVKANLDRTTIRPIINYIDDEVENAST